MQPMFVDVKEGKQQQQQQGCDLHCGPFYRNTSKTAHLCCGPHRPSQQQLPVLVFSALLAGRPLSPAWNKHCKTVFCFDARAACSYELLSLISKQFSTEQLREQRILSDLTTTTSRWAFGQHILIYFELRSRKSESKSYNNKQEELQTVQFDITQNIMLQKQKFLIFDFSN